MNQRLVESIAQIILSMTEDERQLLDEKLSIDSLQQLPEPADTEKSLQIADTEKSLRIAELAQEIHEFEEMYHTPLSELPAERWTVTESDSPSNVSTPAESGHGTNGAESSSSLLPNTLDLGVLGSQPDTETADNSSFRPLSSFVSLSQRLPEESDQDDYAFYDVSTQNGQHSP